jgi:hypothetical protein
VDGSALSDPVGGWLLGGVLGGVLGPPVQIGSGQVPVHTGVGVYQPELPGPSVIWKPDPMQLWIGLDCAIPVARTFVNDACPGAWTCNAYVPAPSMRTLLKLSPFVAPSIQCSAA